MPVDRGVALGGTMPASLAPTEEVVPPGVSLPAGYKSKRCRICKVWSTSLSPWPLEGTSLAAWAPLIAWARGTKDKPISSNCKICIIVP